MIDSEINLMLREVSRVEREVVREASLITQRARRSARAAVAKSEPFHLTVNFKKLRILTSKMLILQHLQGVRRAQLQVPKGLSLDFIDEAIKRLSRLTREDYRALAERYDTKAFEIVDGLQQSVEDDLRRFIADLITQGQSTRNAKKLLDEKFSSLGLQPKNSYTIENIFRTQSQLAYNAGKWNQFQDPVVDEILWGYKYVTVGDDRVRPTHEAIDGVTLPKSDPFWQQFWPPNGWSCRCQVIPIFEARKAVRAPVNLDDGTPVVPDRGFEFNVGLSV